MPPVRIAPAADGISPGARACDASARRFPKRRDEGAARLPAETLSIGSGACRDFALLMAETLRANGVAARLASGYLCEFEAEEKRAEGALHAWTEAYLPGAGWVGFDATNGILYSSNWEQGAMAMKIKR